MPKVTGVFDLFEDLDTISVENVMRWLKRPPDPLILYNFLANRVLYPQSISVSKEEMEWELAFLREALRLNPEFLNQSTKKIIIPEVFVNRVSDLSSLVLAFVDAYILGWTAKNSGENVWTLILRNEEKDEIIGSVLMPEFHLESGNIAISVLEKNIQTPKGGVSIIPCPHDRCLVNYKVVGGKVLGIEQGSISMYGGRLGILIDGRG